MRRARALARLGIIPLLFVVTACGKSGGGSPAAVDPNAPVISNLRASFGSRCTLRSGLPGTIETLAFDFTDADGNVRGGTLEDSTTPDGGSPIVLTSAIPAPGVAITGTTSGTITVTFCVHFGGTVRFAEQVKIIDASGKASNVLGVDLTSPAGAPLLPRDADPAFRKSLGSPE